MQKMKFVVLSVACLFLMACGDSGAKTATNSASASGGEQPVAQTGKNGVKMSGQQQDVELEESYADAEE